MTRNLKAPALVLRMNPVGENHRGLSMLVSGEGLIRPLAFGAQGRRSALRGTAVPFNRGIADLHYDGAKNSWRLTAFDPEDTHDGFREDLDRFYAATSWAEILLSIHGGGTESTALYALAAPAFSLMSLAAGDEIPRLNTAFLWTFLELEGIRPDPSSCGRCGRMMPIGGGDGSARFYGNGLLCCPSCSEDRGEAVPDGARRWLEAASELSLGEAMKLGLPAPALKAAESWLLTVVQSALEKPLRSLRSLGSSP